MRDFGIKIYIAGHKGMVGAAIYRTLSNAGYQCLIGRSSSELDLRDQLAVREFFQQEKPEVVVVAAARVGGILANNNYPYQFLLENLQIQNNLISAAHECGVQKLIFLGSSCIYPRLATQPIKEEYLLTGSLEATNQWYAIAKIAGLKLCESLKIQYGRDYVSLMPTNLYGQNDNFDLTTSHVLPAMIRKFHEAKMSGNKPVELWGTGTPLREFLHVDDLADAVLFSLTNELGHSLYNVGSGSEISIRSLALVVQNVIGHRGNIIFDQTKPDGTPRKVMDSGKMNSLGWSPKIDLEAGIRMTYQWYLDNVSGLKNLKIKD